MTVDELAARSRSTTRNVRALQTSGVLLRPAILGRTAHYGEAHLDRLEAVLRLQEAGFSIASIRILFEAADTGLSLEDVLGVHHRHRQEQLRQAGPPRLLSIIPSTLIDLAV
jgi:DNA-binding transcriptional MerR regulator